MSMNLTENTFEWNNQSKIRLKYYYIDIDRDTNTKKIGNGEFKQILFNINLISLVSFHTYICVAMEHTSSHHGSCYVIMLMIVHMCI